MKLLPNDDPQAVAVTKAIQEGDQQQLAQLLTDDPDLGAARIHDREADARRTLLHIATDWPGHFPHVAETIALLVRHGADSSAPLQGPHCETPLHWAASSNDVAAIDALIDAGADLDAQGAVIAGGDPLEDAMGFQNWEAARRLVERGATTTLGDEAGLGLMDRVRARFESGTQPSSSSIDYSFWNACCGGQLEPAQFLLPRGANINWIPDWCEESPLDGALQSGNEALVAWLESHGAQRNAS